MHLDCVTVGKTLKQKWDFGAQIGGGGFARVVKAVDENGTAHAAKIVKKQPGASREMLLAELDGVRNVVPVVDSGEIADEYVLVMPLADESLRDHVEKNGPLAQTEALQILIDIVTALTDLDRRVVHRDLKPENVLLLNGSWCLADFGIARYTDATTEAGETRKHLMTGAYAAPEQWTAERATAATDIYALGVMAYEILEGRRPFKGSTEDLRDAHLHTEPPALTVGPVLAALVQECLFKAPEARPTAVNLLAKLTKIEEHAADSRWERLAAVNHTEMQRRATAEAESAREQTELEHRKHLFNAATASWSRISEQFHDIINDYLSAATLTVRDDNHWIVELNGAKFGLSYPESQNPRRPEIPFDVIATATLTVLTPKIPRTDRFWQGRSHSLYYADALVEGEYAWFETAFMVMPLSSQVAVGGQEPFAMNNLGEADLHHALGKVIGMRQVAWDFTPIDAGDCHDFIQRWLDWFTYAAQGRLHRPSQMPERHVDGNWRR